MSNASTEPTDLTIDENNIAARYVLMLNLASNCTKALEIGNWRYLADKARELRRAAKNLEAAAVRGDRAQATPRAKAILGAMAIGDDLDS